MELKESPGEEFLAALLRSIKAPHFERQFRFHPDRKFAADFAWPEKKLLAEVQGGTAAHHRAFAHTSAQGYEADCERMAEAVLLGYRVLWFTTAMVFDGRALTLIERALGLPPCGRTFRKPPARKPGSRPRGSRAAPVRRLVLPG